MIFGDPRPVEQHHQRVSVVSYMDLNLSNMVLKSFDDWAGCMHIFLLHLAVFTEHPIYVLLFRI